MGYNVFNAIAKGIVVAIDRTMLVKHAELLTFTFSWSRNVLSKIAQSEKKMVQWMATNRPGIAERRAVYIS